MMKTYIASIGIWLFALSTPSLAQQAFTVGTSLDLLPKSKELNYSIIGNYYHPLKAKNKKQENRYHLIAGLTFSDISDKYERADTKADCPGLDPSFQLLKRERKQYILRLHVGAGIALIKRKKFNLSNSLELGVTNMIYSHYKYSGWICHPPNYPRRVPYFNEGKNKYKLRPHTIFFRTGLCSRFPINKKLGIQLNPSLTYHFYEPLNTGSFFEVAFSGGLVFNLL